MTGERFAAWGLSDLVSKGGVAVAAVFSSGCRPSLGICMSLLNNRLRCQVLGGTPPHVVARTCWGHDLGKGLAQTCHCCCAGMRLSGNRTEL